MRPLHIAHTEASLGWGGQEIRIITEAVGMLERGHQVTLLCPMDPNIFNAAQKRQVDVVDLPIGRKKPRGVLALRAWLKGQPVDIVNTHSSTDSWLAALAAETLKNPQPLIRTRHISASVSRNYSTRWLYTKATRHIVTTGEVLRQRLIDANGFDPTHITSVPTGIDLARFVPGNKRRARAQLGLPLDTSVIGILEAVTPEQTGLIDELQRAEPLRFEIEHLLHVEALRTRPGEAARHKALQRFGTAAILDKVERVCYGAAGHG